MCNTNQLVQTAINIAIMAHAGQYDRSGTPYINHPIHVALLCETDEQKIVALLHDVLEDTSWTVTDLLKAGIPHHLVDAVICITKVKGEPYLNYLARVMSNDVSHYVKIRDIDHNTSDYRLDKEEQKEEWYKYLKGKYEGARKILGTLPSIKDKIVIDTLKEVYNEIKTSGMADTTGELMGINRAARIIREKWEKLERGDS